MIYLLIISAVVNLLAAAVILHLKAELRQRDRHLDWVDRRDEGVKHLFQKVNEARTIPLTNPLTPMKAHGMVTRNAVNNAAMYLTEMDERLDLAHGFLRRAIESSKDLVAWETANPAPPVSRKGKRNAKVGQPGKDPVAEMVKNALWPKNQTVVDGTATEERPERKELQP